MEVAVTAYKVLRTLGMAVVALGLVGCIFGKKGNEDETDFIDDVGDDDDATNQGLDEDDFLDLFEDTFCDAVAACPGAVPCDVNGYLGSERCQYDRYAAEACIDDPYECVDSSCGPTQVYPPVECSQVYSFCD